MWESTPTADQCGWPTPNTTLRPPTKGPFTNRLQRSNGSAGEAYASGRHTLALSEKRREAFPIYACVAENPCEQAGTDCLACMKNDHRGTTIFVPEISVTPLPTHNREAFPFQCTYHIRTGDTWETRHTATD